MASQFEQDLARLVEDRILAPGHDDLEARLSSIVAALQEEAKAISRTLAAERDVNNTEAFAPVVAAVEARFAKEQR